MPDPRCVDHVYGGKRSTRRELGRAVAALADAQHGVVARRQLLDLGLERRGIDVRLEQMQFHPVHRGVYAVGRHLLTLEGRWMAAVLAGGATAVLSHRSAGQLWGILPRTDAGPEITRPTAARPRPGLIVHRSAIPGDEITVMDGIPATGLARTVLDLAGRSPRDKVEQMLNEAEVRGLTDRASVPMLLARYPRRAGSVLLKQIFRERSHAQGVTKKELERRFRLLLDSTDLPRPRRNAHLAVGGRFFEVDCIWAEQRLVVELDGRAVHGTPRSFEHDRERDRLLVADGWRVVRITWLQLRDEAPAVIADLRRMLRCAEPGPRRTGVPTPLAHPPPTL